MKTLSSRILFLFIALCFLGACGNSNAEAPPFEVKGEIKIPPELKGISFQFSFLLKDSSIAQTNCSADNEIKSPKIFCSADHIHTSFALEDTQEIILQASGFHSQKIESSDFIANQKEIPLVKQESSQQNENWVNGFFLNNPKKLLQEYSLPSKSELGEVWLIKFIITNVKEKPDLYFIQTKNNNLHYQFAHDVLSDSRSNTEFDQDTYYSTDKNTIAGTLFYYPNFKINLLGLESAFFMGFFPSDAITLPQIALAHRLIQDALRPLQEKQPFHFLNYLPSNLKRDQELEQYSVFFQHHFIPTIKQSQLFGQLSHQLLNPGIAFGTLKKFTPQELETKVLSYRDIVLLTQLPNSLPLVSGTITEELQTPLAHVNLAARARNTPNIAFNGAQFTEDLQPFINQLIRFEVNDSTYSIRLADPVEAQSFWDSQKKSTQQPSYSLLINRLLSFDSIRFNDSKEFGAKVANLAELHKLNPQISPRGFGVPFYFYDQFIDSAQVTLPLCQAAQSDCLSEGRSEKICADAMALCTQSSPPLSLRKYISFLLKKNSFQNQSNLREASLDMLRYHFRHIPLPQLFAQELDRKVYQMFKDTVVRLRSSTNAEDLADFSGAGLYKSVSASGFGDDAPHLEIRKVWASVWNWKAYEERSWWNMDHLKIRMGVAVHKATSDEVANGVLITQNIANPRMPGMYVNVQKGEESVTNPVDGHLPEILSIVPGPDFIYTKQISQYSDLSPEHSLLDSIEMQSLHRAAQLIQNRFSNLYQESPYSFALDLEFKFYGKDRQLMIKQVRPYLP